MQKRLIAEIKKLSCILAAGIIFAGVVFLTKTGLPCPFYSITGLLCPSCGATRMVLSVLRLDFFSAYSYNKALFTTAPILIAIFIYTEYKYIKTGTKDLGRATKIILWAEVCLLIVFGAVRNII